ncbi:MAG: DHH family phosphoesterase [Oscillospiraceae bacterium]|jgi:phosphoesterase RecJ-like protein|nr:DHH family phosphoesterase [Oscillospiraceae bacterium]
MPSTNITLDQAAEFLRSRDNFLLVTHKNPDGDTLGSALALCLALRGNGKTAHLLRNAQVTALYAPAVEAFFVPEYDPAYTAVSIDASVASQLQKNYDGFPIGLTFDHHASHRGYAENYYVGDTASCGEVILAVLRTLNWHITPDIAYWLYVAVATDTGCFRYSNTTQATLQAGADLVRLGAPNAEINRKFISAKRRSRLLLEGAILGNLQFHDKGRVVLAFITLETLKAAGADVYDLDDIANIAAQCDGPEVAATLREMPDGTTKISVRTIGEANANDICAKLGGGGHARASGVSLSVGIEEAAALFLEACKS